MIFHDSFRASEFLRAYQSCFPPLEERLVGVGRSHDSGYYSIKRFYGSEPIDPRAIRVRVEPGQFSFSDPLVKEFADYHADRLTEQRRLYDGPLVAGFKSLTFDGNAGVLTIQKTSYRAFAGSLFGLDLPYPAFDKYGGTLRHYYVKAYGRVPYDERPLANCLGVCGHLLVEDAGQRYLLQVKRARRLATLAGTWGPSAAGSVDFESDYASLWDILIRALGQEVREELLLADHEFEILPLAFARETFRPDNPQLFGLIRTSLPASVVKERLESIPEAEREFSEFSLVSLGKAGRLSADAVDRFNFEACMSYYLLEEYLHSVDSPMVNSNDPQLERMTVSRPALPGRVVLAVLFVIVAIVVAYAVNRVMYGDDEIPANRRRPLPVTSVVLDSTHNLSTYTLTSVDIRKLKAAGLTQPASQILYDLTNHNDLIPVEGSLGGTMLFFPTESHLVGPNRVLAYFEDGHSAGRLLMGFTVAEGKISWEVIERLPPPTP